MSAIPRPMVEKVLSRDGHACVLRLEGCLGTASVADHRVNRGHGGSKVLNNPANLIAACGLCNGAKEDATDEVRAELVRRGLRVKPDRTHQASLLRATLTPVEYPDGSEWWLTRDGRRVDLGEVEF